MKHHICRYIKKPEIEIPLGKLEKLFLKICGPHREDGTKWVKGMLAQELTHYYALVQILVVVSNIHNSLSLVLNIHIILKEISTFPFEKNVGSTFWFRNLYAVLQTLFNCQTYPWLELFFSLA